MKTPKIKKEKEKKVYKITPQILDVHTMLEFGKYCVKYVFEVIRIDPDYLRWLHENTDCKLTDAVIIRINKEQAIKNQGATAWIEYTRKLDCSMESPYNIKNKYSPNLCNLMHCDN